jgi:hypothetical protein
MKRTNLAFLLSFPLTACGAVEAEPPACPETPPTCITRSESCEAAGTVDPVCEGHAWNCPEGSSDYVRAAASEAVCLPFSGETSPFTSLGGSLARVPIDGGRCLWVAETATTKTGAALRNVGLLPETDAAFGACPSASSFAGGDATPVVEIEGANDPSLLVQIDGGFVLNGDTKVLYRLFRSDADATFGVTLLGSGIGKWDASAQRIVVPGASDLSWDPSIDPGDASLVVSGMPYVWGCHAPASFLTNPCALARLDGTEVEFLTTDDGWATGVSVGETQTVFSSGPWISSVVPASAGGFLHVYAVGFGSTLETHTAASVTGPWQDGPTLTQCNLPSDDTKAFCAGPVVHTELTDPTREGEVVVSYGVGTTASEPAESGTLSTSYWTRLVWATAP